MALADRRASKSNDVEVIPIDTIHARPKTPGGAALPPTTSGSGSSAGGDLKHGVPEVIGADEDSPEQNLTLGQRFKLKRHSWFRYIKTKDFWLVLLLGQVLSICITSTNTLSELLANEGTNIPAFQTLFNYILLNLIYTSFTIYRYGFRKWFTLLYKDGWRYFILAFMDVEGNYFTVLAYRYTTILSAQLINFWAIVVVVLISAIVLRVRYHLTQILGIFICIGGVGLLIGSDHITGSNGGYAPHQVKGDMWALGGATFYGLSNIFEEFLVSERPFYEVVGQLAFWGMFINGTQAGIFDRASFRSATWNSAVGGYLTGYTLVLTLFYTLAPLMFRLASAAFFNLSLLTGNFWGAAIGVQVFHLHIYKLYYPALVLIILGHIVYFMAESVLGEAKKPWLGENQEKGVSGIGTAKRQEEQGGFLGTGKGSGWAGKVVGMEHRLESMRRQGDVTEGTPGAGVV